MNLLSLLGRLPASDSASGTLNRLDILKTFRMAVVVLVSAFVLAFGTSITAVCNPNACDLSQGIHTLLTSAFQAGITAVVAAGTELFRRLVANNG